MKLDKQKLLDWLEIEMNDSSQGYRAGIKWAAYHIEKGKFDSSDDFEEKYNSLLSLVQELSESLSWRNNGENKEVLLKMIYEWLSRNRYFYSYSGNEYIKLQFNQHKQEPYVIRSKIEYKGNKR